MLRGRTTVLDGAGRVRVILFQKQTSDVYLLRSVIY